MAVADLVIFAVIFGGFMLLSQLISRALARARRQQALGQRQPPAPLPEDASPDAAWGPRPQAETWQGATGAELARRLEPITSGIRPQHPAASSNALFRSRRELRHAVVLMTVLGPCRALDPPDRS